MAQSINGADTCRPEDTADEVVTVKHAGKSHDIALVQGGAAPAFKQSIYQATGVPVGEQGGASPGDLSDMGLRSNEGNGERRHSQGELRIG